MTSAMLAFSSVRAADVPPVVPDMAAPSVPPLPPAPLPPAPPLPPIAPPVIPMPPVLDAIVAASMEARAANGGSTDLAKQLDTMQHMEYSAATKQKLIDVFGTDHPLDIQYNMVKGGRDYVVLLHPHSYRAATGGGADWSEMRVELALDKSGRNVAVQGSWPSLLIESDLAHAQLRDMSMQSKQHQIDGIWYGQQQLRIGSVLIDHISGLGALHIDGIQLRANLTRRGKFADLDYRFGSDAVSSGEESVEHVNYGLRVLNIDAKALADFSKGLQRDVAGKTVKQQRDAMLPLFKTFGKAVVKKGIVLAIDDISASYHGNTAAIKGRVAFEKVQDKDFDAPFDLFKKIIAHFEVRVPVALVQDVTHTVLFKMAKAKAGTASFDADALVKQAHDAADAVIGKMVGEGYARVENGELRSNIDFKGGKLTVNGKAVALPTMSVQPKRAPVPVPPRAPKQLPSVPEAPAAPAPEAPAAPASLAPVPATSSTFAPAIISPKAEGLRPTLA